MSVVTLSCRETKDESHAEKAHEHDKDMASNDAFACPMDCEKKTYEAEGACPVCNMVLKRVEENEDAEHNHDSDSKEHHDNDNDPEKKHEHDSKDSKEHQ